MGAAAGSRARAPIGRKDRPFADKPSGAVKSALKRSVSRSTRRAHPEEERGTSTRGPDPDGAQPKSEGFSGVLLGRRSDRWHQGIVYDRIHVNPVGRGVDRRGRVFITIERTVGAPEDGATTGIVAVHPYAAETIPRSVQLTDDGLYAGGDWRTASTLVEKGMANPFRFRLFAQATRWQPGELEKEIQAGAWLCARPRLPDRPRAGRLLWTSWGLRKRILRPRNRAFVEFFRGVERGLGAPPPAGQRQLTVLEQPSTHAPSPRPLRLIMP